MNILTDLQNVAHIMKEINNEMESQLKTKREPSDEQICSTIQRSLESYGVNVLDVKKEGDCFAVYLGGKVETVEINGTFNFNDTISDEQEQEQEQGQVEQDLAMKAILRQWPTYHVDSDK